MRSGCLDVLCLISLATAADNRNRTFSCLRQQAARFLA